MNIKNIKYRRTGTVHIPLDWKDVGIIYTKCGLAFWKTEVRKTTDPITCKNCLKVKSG